MNKKYKPIIKGGQEWSFELIDEIYHHINRIAKEKYDLSTYQNQIEIISSEQMLDAYTSIGMPLSYNHWSFGESFIKQEAAYKQGQMGLALKL